MSAPRVVVAFGTRAEKIKLAPVVKALRAREIEVIEWYSGQHQDLVGASCGVRSANWGQGITHGIANTMRTFAYALQSPPACVIVQGDTATAFACAQAAFLAKVPVAHVEAGMRTYASEPWPEEAFRRQIAAVAKWHFCPDRVAAENVARECHAYNIVEIPSPRDDDYNWLFEELKVKAGIHVVGNTIIDTLPLGIFRVLVTLHRRENWGARRVQALRTLSEFDHAHNDLWVEIMRHPNGVEDYAVADVDHLLDGPFGHATFLEMVQESDLVVTDSGGLQEECAHFGIPCIVLRTSTERVALERTGAVTLVCPDDPNALRGKLEAFLGKRFCYGAGDASEKIADVLARELAPC